MSFYFKAAKSEKDPQRIANFLIDDEFLNTFNLEVLEGEDLPISGREDTIGYAFINEAFVKFFDMKDPVGSFIDGNNRNKVIKVVKDFNVKSLHHKMEPVIMLYSSNWFRHIAVKVSGSNISAALDHLAEEYTNYYTGYPFDYAFLDDDIAKQYETEQKLSTLFKFFSAIAILIAGLGLVGLASYMVNQRTKEIGIRKVLGSSVGQLVTLFSKHFIHLLVVSILISFPIAWYLMNEWLASFAYRISITGGFFIYSTVIVLITLTITVGFQILKAALVNPVETLRCE